MDKDNNLDTRVISQIITRVASTVIAAGVTVILVVDSMYNIPKKPRINREEEKEDYINSIIHGSDCHCIDQIHCMGAIDGKHVRASVPITLQARFYGRKEGTKQNVLAVVSFDLKFMYMLAEWEGSAHNSRILDDALSRPNELRVPEGKYLLGDAGYGLCNGFILPYRGVRYHLKEYSNQSPENEELFNLRHSSLRTTVERAFGKLRKHFGAESSSWEAPSDERQMMRKRRRTAKRRRIVLENAMDSDVDLRLLLQNPKQRVVRFFFFFFLKPVKPSDRFSRSVFQEKLWGERWLNGGRRFVLFWKTSPVAS
ncbi:hypothetical protein HHK36_027169 [Tetracentron sinense]|uniref:DDE Tnp4 domain-containing protein n=1 Tax=Tetracentron sinense TaxID=13715 RepID=A0A834YGW5_TETSI|nr:hypothetical protein HHK36_027169 [Tetracentron sinense]